MRLKQQENEKESTEKYLEEATNKHEKTKIAVITNY